jgi:hypothetical protein
MVESIEPPQNNPSHRILGGWLHKIFSDNRL